MANKRFYFCRNKNDNANGSLEYLLGGKNELEMNLLALVCLFLILLLQVQMHINLPQNFQSS